jgi:hypothetical protein
MREEKDALDGILEAILPKRLRPFAPTIFAIIVIIGVLILIAWAYGYESLLVLLVSSAIICAAMFLFVIIKDVFWGKSGRK